MTCFVSILGATNLGLLVALISDMAGLYVCLCIVPNREGFHTDSEDRGHPAGLYSIYYIVYILLNRDAPIYRPTISIKDKSIFSRFRTMV